MRPRRHKYFVTTWDSDSQTFTPQAGVWPGPYTKFGLRRALRALRDTGYQANRSDSSVYVRRDDDGIDAATIERWYEYGWAKRPEMF